MQEAHRAGITVAAHAHGGAEVDICAQEGVDSIEHGGLLTPRNIETMTARGTWLVLTNDISFHPSGIEAGDSGNQQIVERVRRVRASIERTFEETQASGLRFALGTDSMHGLFGYELEWLVQHGVEPEGAIVAPTSHGAEVMGLANDVGTLEPGKCAKIVALGDNPLEDIRAVYDVVGVLKGGCILEKPGESTGQSAPRI